MADIKTDPTVQIQQRQVFRTIDCPVCGGRSFVTVLKVSPSEFLNESRRRYYNLGALGITEETGFFIKKCRGCGFVFVNPRLRPELYSVVYNEAKSGQYCGKEWAYEEGDLKSLYNTHHKWSAALTCMKVFSYLKARYRKPRNDGHKRIRLLDYGCGYGHVLDLCKVFEIDAVGVEIDRSRLEYCRKRGHTVCLPDELELERQFDLVVSTSVIEHIDDLNAYFKFIGERIKIGGMFHCNGLTQDIVKYEKRRGVFRSVIPTEHINYFTRRSLDSLAGHYGFHRIKKMHHVHVIERPIEHIYFFLKNVMFRGFYRSGVFEAEFIKSTDLV